MTDDEAMVIFNLLRLRAARRCGLDSYPADRVRAFEAYERLPLRQRAALLRSGTGTPWYRVPLSPRTLRRHRARAS